MTRVSGAAGAAPGRPLTEKNSVRKLGGGIKIVEPLIYAAGQAGSYGEHTFTTATAGETTLNVNGPRFEVELAPGAGAQIKLGTKRYANPPTLALPW